MLPFKNTRLNQVNQTHYKQFQKPIPVHFFTWRNCTEFSISILPYRSMRAITHPICCVCVPCLCAHVCLCLQVHVCGSRCQHGAHGILSIFLITGCAEFGGRDQIKPNGTALKTAGWLFSAHLLLPTEYSTGNSSAQQGRQSCCARCCNTYALSTLHHLTLKILT